MQLKEIPACAWGRRVGICLWMVVVVLAAWMYPQQPEGDEAAGLVLLLFGLPMSILGTPLGVFGIAAAGFLQWALIGYWCGKLVTRIQQKEKKETNIR
ncbi:MAG: hypothetical protein WA081_10445 [Desulfosalsimonadaceae bacterium]